MTNFKKNIINNEIPTNGISIYMQKHGIMTIYKIVYPAMFVAVRNSRYKVVYFKIMVCHDVFIHF